MPLGGLSPPPSDGQDTSEKGKRRSSMWEDGSDDEMIHMCDNQRVGMQCGFLIVFSTRILRKKTQTHYCFPWISI